MKIVLYLFFLQILNKGLYSIFHLRHRLIFLRPLQYLVLETITMGQLGVRTFCPTYLLHSNNFEQILKVLNAPKFLEVFRSLEARDCGT